jgi:hypothetical protein
MEGMTADQSSAAPSDETPSEQATDPVQATKQKFKEALAAKQARHGEDHIDSGPQHVHGHGPVETKRVFRRKTG